MDDKGKCKILCEYLEKSYQTLDRTLIERFCFEKRIK